jgi:hypothetical protein
MNLYIRFWLNFLVLMNQLCDSEREICAVVSVLGWQRIGNAKSGLALTWDLHAISQIPNTK